jgi:hypothetical protein
MIHTFAVLAVSVFVSVALFQFKCRAVNRNHPFIGSYVTFAVG